MHPILRATLKLTLYTDPHPDSPFLFPSLTTFHRATKLMPEPVPIPPAVEALLSLSMDKFGMLALSVTSSAVASLPTLLRLEEAEDEETLSTMQGLR